MPNPTETVREEPLRLTERALFNRTLRTTIGKLTAWERARNSQMTGEDKERYFRLRLDIELSIDDFTPEEKSLYSSLFGLFELKNKIGRGNEILSRQKSKGKLIGFLGPLGVAKTTIAETLIKDLRAESVTHEPYSENPFWSQSQNNPQFMLRSQMYFLFSNIFSDIETKLSPGISVSDTSTLTDILMWAQWYHQTGHFDHKEYLVYQELVNLLKDVIPKPDLLVVLKPENVDDLKEGVRQRAARETQRSGELVFTDPASDDLAVQVEIVENLSRTIPQDWGIPVLNIAVPSIRVFTDRDLRYEYVYSIRERLGLLGDLIEPSPEIAAEQAVRFLAESDDRQIIIIHSKSMFTGKTTTQCLMAEKLGRDKIIAFQPRAAIRYSDQVERGVMSRDGGTIPATTIEDNNLWSIVDLIKKHKINPKDYPYIFIDEIMLFTAQSDQPQKAIEALQELCQVGFHVIVDGIDYTFQEEPFTFMHDLLARAKKDPNWHAIEMSTRCRYCERRAQGTRMVVDGQPANYNFDFVRAGDVETYEPVCCHEHPSCEGKPDHFLRKELP